MRVEIEILVQCPWGHVPHYEDIKDCEKCEHYEGRFFLKYVNCGYHPLEED